MPDELPWDDVMKVAYPFLGTCWSGPIDWDPLSSRVNSFDTWSGRYSTATTRGSSRTSSSDAVPSGEVGSVGSLLYP